MLDFWDGSYRLCHDIQILCRHRLIIGLKVYGVFDITMCSDLCLFQIKIIRHGYNHKGIRVIFT